MIENLREVFNNYKTMTAKIETELNNINFSITSDGAHHKLRFNGDERYNVSFAKTTSDRRTGSNIVNHIKNQFF